MRDPKRIRPLLDRLERVWEEHPEQRLSQLIANGCLYFDPYYIEDEQLLKNLEDVFLDIKKEKE